MPPTHSYSLLLTHTHSYSLTLFRSSRQHCSRQHCTVVVVVVVSEVDDTVPHCTVIMSSGGMRKILKYRPKVYRHMFQRLQAQVEPVPNWWSAVSEFPPKYHRGQPEKASLKRIR